MFLSTIFLVLKRLHQGLILPIYLTPRLLIDPLTVLRHPSLIGLVHQPPRISRKPPINLLQTFIRSLDNQIIHNRHKCRVQHDVDQPQPLV